MNKTIVDTPGAFDAALTELEKFSVLGLDSETVGHESYRLFTLAERMERDAHKPRERYEHIAALHKSQYKNRDTRVREFRDHLHTRAKRATKLAADTVRAAQRSPSGLNFWENSLACLQLAGYSFGYARIFLIRPSVINDPLRLGVLLNSAKLLLAHNLQFDWKQLKQHLGVALSCHNVHDSYVAEYLIRNGKFMERTGLKAVVKKYLDIDMNKGEQVSNWHADWSDEQVSYAVNDVVYLPRVYTQQMGELRRLKLVELFKQECKLLPVVAKMEMEGIGVDVSKVKKQWLPEYSSRVSLAQQELREALQIKPEDPFNPKSNPQLLSVLQEAGLPINSTDKNTLKKYKDHPAIQKLFEFRELTKVLGTYLEPFLSRSVETLPGHHRVYGTFSPYKVETGRFSSADPNLQNLPADEAFRSIFIPRPGHVFVSGDLSQIELRVLAEVSQDPNLLMAFRDGIDCHTFAASLVHGIPLEELSRYLRAPEEELSDEGKERKKEYKALRGATKTIQFGIIYGQTEFGLAKGLGISERKAKALIRRYFLNYQQVERSIRATKEKSLVDGCVRTLGGRIRFLNGIDSKDKWVRERAERQSFNTLIQGTAADGMKLSMIRFDELARPYPFHLVAVVHDEVLVEVPDNPVLIDKAKRFITQAFIEGNERYIKSVPVQVGSEDRNWEPVVVRNWGEAK